jgi:hypothetical protein
MKGAENLNEPDAKRVVKQRQGEKDVVAVVVVVVAIIVVIAVGEDCVLSICIAEYGYVCVLPFCGTMNKHRKLCNYYDINVQYPWVGMCHFLNGD